ncbi:MAG: PSD1 domain-containing protein [Verrucomicrobiales bacterium]|nr:PSD1 domain-containing protein [Verrucomicrobiales bacterium]
MFVYRFVAFLPALLAFSAAAQTPNRGEEFYKAKILPVLESRCYDCHSVESGKSKGGLLLDSAEAMKKGGDTGPAIVPGNAARSLIYEAITYNNPDMEMPPKEQLSAEVVKDFETWIRGGAPIPASGSAPVPAPAMTDTVPIPEPQQGGKIKNPQDFWAFKRPLKLNPAKVIREDWPKNVVDRFVLAEMEKHQLTPVPDADRPTLIRRAYFDLIGLPPSPVELDAFVEDESPDAFAKVIDRLLASKHFGERWGRHWLDVARYAESNGGDSNVTYPHAWRYRDYVIDSFNKDKPYDRFLTEQIAGDLLDHKNEAARTEHLVATGFLALGTKNLLQRSTLQFQLDMADEQIDATSRAFLGMTFACARCHDHKFDPISQKDYYAMAGIFMSSNTEYGTLEQTDYNLQSDTLLSITVNDGTAEKGTLSAAARVETETRIADIESQLLSLRGGGPGGKGGKGKGGKGGKGAGNMAGEQMDEVTLRRTRIRLQRELDHETNYLRKFDTDGNALTQAMGVKEGDPHDIPVYLRGELGTPGETVKRGFVSFLDHGTTPKIPATQSGRLELAQWLTDPDNSLTSRVMINRVWGKLFGSPLVVSTENFGGMGQAPSHPELLDLLAVAFRDSGWSVKKMIRALMLTRTYQLSSTVDQSNYAIDPDNIFLWRASQKRLEAEVLRDTVLFVSGQLEERPVKSQIYERGDVQVGDVRRRLFELPDYDVRYRSVYLPILRGYLPDSLALFDFAEPSLVVGMRNDTLVPAQALYMMNSDFIQKYSRLYSEGMMEKDADATNRIRHAYRVILSRAPNDEELGFGEDFIQRYSALMAEEGSSPSEAEMEALAALTQSLFSNAEFRYVN